MQEIAAPPLAAATYAAVDLGSNSFHMIVARMDAGQLVIVDRIRESVRLGEGLRPDKTVDPEVRQRALDCLARFGQRLRTLSHQTVRAVGTNTMRQLHDGGAFLREAELALGHPVEIISGREEARLVYLGVAHGLAAGNEPRLVVDIGGGSTEVIVGRGMTPDERESLYMGCVNTSQRYFAGGDISADRMKNAVLACQVEIRPVRKLFEAGTWERAVGSSGTIRTIRAIVIENGWSEEGITASALKKLRKALVAAGHVNKIDLRGLSDDRRPVIAGGVAVLSAVFKSLGIEKMKVSDLALREGLLYELVGYTQHHDVRDRTVASMVKRFTLDTKQSRRVELTATGLLGQVASQWCLTEPDHHLVLGWACQLHEIGLSLSHNSFHKHGAYIVANADMPGFSRQQQMVLAALIRVHRRRFAESAFSEIPKALQECARRVAVLLRLAVLIHRGRSRGSKPGVRIEVDDKAIQVRFPAYWLEAHPLTQLELASEAEHLGTSGFTLTYS